MADLPQHSDNALSQNGHRTASAEDLTQPAAAVPALVREPVDLSRFQDPALYLNRELSWLRFNERVFGEAVEPEHPLLERVKFVAIGHSNLDEYYMVRISGLQQQIAAGLHELSPDGMTPVQQIAEFRAQTAPILQSANDLFRRQQIPELRRSGIHILDWSELSRTQTRALRDYFRDEVFPVLTPLALGPGHPFPHISNLSLNLAVVIRDPQVGERFARMKVPGVLPRFVPCPSANGEKGHPGSGTGRGRRDQLFVWLEDLIAANLSQLFPGMQIIESHPFRVTRDADIEIREDEASDLLQTVELGLQRRHFGDVCRLEITAEMPERLRSLLVEHLLVDNDDVYALDGRLGLSDLMQLMKLERPDLKDATFVPAIPPELTEPARPILDVVAQKDLLLHHPYDAFSPVIDFIESGTRDAGVLAIKQTLYRVGTNSPIVKALAEARDDDTQVAVLVELKARFDEENNIEWARALEESGVHVVYGFVGLKTHCKLAMVVRKERDGKLKRYAHIGTGNYNPFTARIYTDISFFTSRPDITADVAELFNHLTGYSRQTKYRKLLVAPVNMREGLLDLIAREAEHARAGRPAHLILKTNTLTDEPLIQGLYAAAEAGVRIDMVIRGVCCLRPGLPGLSENVRVVSVIGRFLEHSRIYYFHNNGDPDIYVGSADLMRRNLERRVEALVPIEDAALKKSIREDLDIYLSDNTKSHELQSDGTYRRVRPTEGQAVCSAQESFLAQRAPQSAEA